MAGNNCAHIIGVVVKDTTSEIKMAAVITTANSWNKRPSTPPMNKIGIKTATNDTLMATTVKPISRLPCNTAWRSGTPRSRKRVMCSSTTIASSTTNPVAIVSAIRLKLFKLKLSKYITAHVPAKDNGTATAGISAVRQRFKKSATTKITKPIEMASDF